MGIFKECPWCEKTFHTKTYPPAASFRDLMEIENKHMEQEHPEKYKEYKEICEVWYDKVFCAEGIIEFYRTIISDAFDDVWGRKKPNKKIIEDYSAEELKDLPRDKIREIIDDY